MNRRRALALFGGLPFLSTTALAQAPSALGDFNALLSSTLSDEKLLESARDFRERQEEEYLETAAKAARSRSAPSAVKIADEAVKLIVAFEVTSQAKYTQSYQSPIFPGGRSGVTVGIGYDVGYVNSEFLEEDWKSLVPDATIESLAPCCERTAGNARKLIPSLQHVKIAWGPAYEQFEKRVLPRYVADTIGPLPNASMLSDRSLGALVSLVYNRGPSFKLLGDRYKEMRQIRLLMVQKKFDQIPDQLIAMKRLWDFDELPGLHRRRELEAKLFAAGLG